MEILVKNRFLAKYKNFDRQIEILVETRNFDQRNLKFGHDIEILVKNRFIAGKSNF